MCTAEDEVADHLSVVGRVMAGVGEHGVLQAGADRATNEWTPATACAVSTVSAMSAVEMPC